MLFASLPYELRSRIWSLVLEPLRITGVRMEMSDGKFTAKERRRGMHILYETTSTPPPAVMQVCREARQYAPYKACFTAGTEARWTWVNFGVDIFCVTDVFSVSDIVSHRSDVQRLHISTVDDRDWSKATVHLRAPSDLKDFISLREIKIILEPGDFRWGDVVQGINLASCPKENVTFVDARIGLALTAPEVRPAADWAVLLSFDRGARMNPPDPDRLAEETTRAH